MLVGERMTQRPVTVSRDWSVPEALKLMRTEKIRHLPVLDAKGRLAGIVSEKDLLYASPSPATTLDVFEMHYLMSRVKVEGVMKTQVITAAPDTPLEEAARLMADNKVSCLPVIEGDKLVGIITMTDLAKIFLELLGARTLGVRLTMLAESKPGELARITGAISGMGGNIVALGTFLGDDPTNAMVTIKVEGIEEQKLIERMQEMGIEIVDARTCGHFACAS